jgi:fibro-slime domain-containing protein
MTKKQNRSLGFGKRTLSVVLAVLLILSTFAVVITTTSLSASADISYWFVSGNFNGWTNSATSANKINSGTGGSVTIPLSGEYTSSINFKMVAEENGQHWCGVLGGEENVSINTNTKTELKWNTENPKNMKVSFPANTVSATFTLTVENGKNYVTVKPNTEGGGEGGDTGSMTYTAPVNTNNNDNKAANLFWATATYYDYLSDEEISNTKWLKPIQAGTGFNGSIDDWYPFYLFNRDVVKAAADSNSSWSLPLYFGNFCNTYNAYDTSHHPGVSNGFNDATNSYNVTRFKYAPNNSNKDNADSARTGGGIAHQNESYQGLMDSSLDSSGNLMLPGGSVKAPYFDESALTGKAKVVKSSFPFTVKDEGSYKKYEFNSNNAKDNVYFTWNTSGSETYPTGVNYGAGTTYSVKDGISRFMNGGTSGYGIFPFNNASNNNKGTKTNANENLNYGFGVRIDVNFRVPAPSSTVNTASNPIKFNFSGDDDLWMYITNNRTGESQLVLDMGGSHSKSTGEVNFNSLKAKVNNVYNNRTNVEQAFDFNYDDTYTMSVFYMERGLIESNMEMSFTLTPLGNNFIVTEAIDTTNVNEGLKDVITAISEFGFNPYDDNTAVTESPFNDFKLGNGGRMDIPNTILGINSQPNVKQYPPENSYLSYSTSWTYWDNVSNNTRKQLDSGTTSDSSKHRMINESLNEYDYAELQVDYVNTPDVGTFSVEKEMATGATAPAGKTFPATIYLKFKDGSFTPYTLVDDNGNTCTNGRVNLVPGETISFSGIPTGTRVLVVEDSDQNYTALYSHDSNNPYKVSDLPGGITVTNKPNDSTPTSAKISGIKKLDDTNYTGTLFRFVLEGVPRFSGDSSDIKATTDYVETTFITNGVIDFGTFHYTEPGTYRYHVYEDMSYLEDVANDNSATYDTDIFNEQPDYLVSVTVRDEDFRLVADAPVYYEYSRYEADGTTPHTMSSADFSPSKVDQLGMIFYNKVRKGSITINKTNQKNQKVNGVVFQVYPVSDEFIDELNALTNDEDKYNKVFALGRSDYGAVTGPDGEFEEGVAEIGNLPIYQTDYQTSSAPEYQPPKYQQYVMIETNVSGAFVTGAPDAKYNLNKTVHVFSFPMEDQSTHEMKYHLTYDYVNGILKTPSTAGPGMMMFKIIGTLVAALGVLSLGGYVIYTKRSTKRKTAPKHAAK